MRILWVPHTAWHIPQRAHVFGRILAEKHELHVTDWIADFRSLRDYASRRYLRTLLPRTRQDGLILVHGVRRISPALPFRRARALNHRLLAHAVERIIERHRIDVVVGTFVVEPPKAPRVVLDLFDDNVTGWRTRHAEYAKEIECVEAAYLRDADVVVAASGVLADRARSAGATSVELIPNGVDLETVRAADGIALRQELGQGALVGSVGNHDDPDELALLLGLAVELLGEARVLIAGRGTAVAAARARAPANVIFFEDVPYNRAPWVAAALDVGLCPYRGTEMDEARSPMRLLLYSALGIPTVCTDLTEVRALGFPNVITSAPRPDAFAAAVRAALELPRRVPPAIERFDARVLAARYEAVLRGSVDPESSRKSLPSRFAPRN